MLRSEARAILGTESADPAELRAVWRRRLREVHPDINDGADASAATIAITTAYRLLLQPERDDAPRPRTADGHPTPRRPRPTPVAMLSARAIDSVTVEVEASREEAMAAMIEGAQRLGEISYLDPQVGLVEAIVEFVEAPTCSVVMSLQGRATGTVEVFCGVEPLSGGTAPPVEAVTRLLAATLAAIPMADLRA